MRNNIFCYIIWQQIQRKTSNCNKHNKKLFAIRALPPEIILRRVLIVSKCHKVIQKLLHV